STLGTDLTAQERQSCGCGTNFDAGQRQWIDYVFARGWNVTATTQRITNNAADSPYSDHDGLLVRVVYGAAWPTHPHRLGRLPNFGPGCPRLTSGRPVGAVFR